MDPVTHGVIGLALSAFSGNPVAVTNPISIGCALGAMSPDIDIVSKIHGDYVYLKHHRGISHSIPMLAGLSLVISAGLYFFFRDFSFLNIFFWTFIGASSHTLFDILNSYGAKLFMPFSKKKLTVGILMLYDPVITVLSLLLIFKRNLTAPFLFVISAIFFVYLGFRSWMKKKAEKYFMKHYEKQYRITKIHVLPALMAFHKWDAVITTEKHQLVVQINMINKKIFERKRFQKADQELINLFEETKIGKYIKEFTPSYHIMHIKEMEKVVLKCIDLRYFLRNNFMHHATAVFDHEKNIIESFFHPYNIHKNIRVVEYE